jgi:hypothetical protein
MNPEKAARLAPTRQDNKKVSHDAIAVLEFKCFSTNSFIPLPVEKTNIRRPIREEPVEWWPAKEKLSLDGCDTRHRRR